MARPMLLPEYVDYVSGVVLKQNNLYKIIDPVFQPLLKSIYAGLSFSDSMLSLNMAAVHVIT